MFVQDYYYLFLIGGILLLAYAFWRHVKRIKDFSASDFYERETFRSTVFKGFFLQALAQFVGGLLVLMGLIGLIIKLAK